MKPVTANPVLAALPSLHAGWPCLRGGAELDEILNLPDRVAVMSDGQVWLSDRRWA